MPNNLNSLQSNRKRKQFLYSRHVVLQKKLSTRYFRDANQVKVNYLAKGMGVANTDHVRGKVPTCISVLGCKCESHRCVRKCYGG